MARRNALMNPYIGRQKLPPATLARWQTGLCDQIVTLWSHLPAAARTAIVALAHAAADKG
jgi:hypothetical protein